MQADELGQHLDHTLGTDRARHIDDQALAGGLVDDRQALDLLAFSGGVENEVLSPDRVGLEGREGTGPAGSNAPAWPLLGQQQARLAPQAVRARPTQLKALAPQEDADAAVAVARVLRRQRLHRLHDRAILGGLAIFLR